RALEEGVHELLGFDGPIMTDSGTFQMYFHGLPETEIDPLEIIRFQREIGTDIGTILDAFSDPKAGRTQAENDMKLSLERAESAISEKGEMMLAGTVQGGVYTDLRETSAREMAKMPFDVYPIGGVVPLMESYRYTDIVNLTLAVKPILPPDKPIHLFGCGHPMFFAQASLLGCDFFDSASYAKFAESDRMLMPSGTLHLENLRELPCDCPVCSSMDADDLKASKEKTLLLMKHNLYVSSAEMRRVRQAIGEGKLFEYTALRARSHPALLEAFEVMINHYEKLSPLGPVGKTSSLFYTGPEMVKRPEIRLFHQRLMERYPFRNTHTVLLVPHLGDRPLSETTPHVAEAVKKTQPEDLIVLYVTPMGIVPWELEHVHPSQQCVFPSILEEPVLIDVKRKLNQALSAIKHERVLWLDRKTPTNRLGAEVESIHSIEMIESVDALQLPMDMTNALWTMRKLHAIFGHQWGLAHEHLREMPMVDITLSKSTGKIRHVSRKGRILFTLVPNTGLFTPTTDGGLELLKLGINENYIVTMDSSVAEFVAKGKSALAKFVKQASNALINGEEVLVVDENQELLGVGKALLDGSEMLAFDRGVAVLIRHSRKTSTQQSKVDGPVSS
ncbi:MAG: tRNA guanosine(15) transglycosylase TgtA, partial [Promethearchaeota archaeon]